MVNFARYTPIGAVLTTTSRGRDDRAESADTAHRLLSSLGLLRAQGVQHQGP